MHFFHPLAFLERERKKCLKLNFPQSLLPLLQKQQWCKSTRLWDIDFLVLDFETTGLDLASDSILSVGWVIVSNGQIHANSACRIDVLIDGQIKPETAVINHIVSAEHQYAKSVHQAMLQLITEMEGRVIISHCAPIERGFFHQYCKRVFDVDSVALLWLDTMQIEKTLTHNQQGYCQGNYQLASVRSSYGLPRYPGHDALIDALATAELFLAQVKSVFGYMEPYLGPMVERS